MATYSYSRLRTFRQCPRKFYYQYVQKIRLPEEPEHIAPFLGSRVHETLEHLYVQVQRRNIVPLLELLQYFRDTWKQNWTGQVVIAHPELTAAHYRATGEQCIRDYYGRHAPFDQARTIALEHRIAFPLDDGGKHRLQGYVDRIARTADDVWQVHDYKTDARLPTQEDKDRDPQLAFYEIGIRQSWNPVVRVELIWHYLRHDQSITSTRTPEQLQQLRREALDTIINIESRRRDEAEFPTNESRLCEYCDYQTVCPVRRHLIRIRALPKNRFLKEPGVRLVDRWTRLKVQQDALNEEHKALQLQIDEIKEALIAIAAKRHLEVVCGTEKEVSIKQTDKIGFPRKTVETEEAAELEERLRQTKWWNQVSTLDRPALEALWKDETAVPARLRQLLERYVRKEKETVLRLRNRKD